MRILIFCFGGWSLRGYASAGFLWGETENPREIFRRAALTQDDGLGDMSAIPAMLRAGLPNAKQGRTRAAPQQKKRTLEKVRAPMKHNCDAKPPILMSGCGATAGGCRKD
jgi:hypothetical protein